MRMRKMKNRDSRMASCGQLRIDQIRLIIAAQHLRAGLTELGDQPVHHLDMLFPVGIGCVDHMQQQIGIFQLLQGCPESIHQMVGQFRNKANCV